MSLPDQIEALADRMEEILRDTKRLRESAGDLAYENADQAHTIAEQTERLDAQRDAIIALLAALRPLFGDGLQHEAEPEFLDVRIAMLDAERALS